MKHRVLCIDPGLKVAGWALFEISTVHKKGHYIGSGVILCKRERAGKDWLSRLDYAQSYVQKLVEEHRVTRVVIEQPQVFMSAKGMAASNTGATLKLTALVFAIYGALKDLKSMKIILLKPTQWKGSVPKEITQRRIMKHWKVLCKDHNESDAVGLGDYYIRKHLCYQSQ